MKNRMAISDTTKATRLPIASIDILSLTNTSGVVLCASHKLFTDAASMVGTARKNENSAAVRRSSL